MLKFNTFGVKRTVMVVSIRQLLSGLQRNLPLWSAARIVFAALLLFTMLQLICQGFNGQISCLAQERIVPNFDLQQKQIQRVAEHLNSCLVQIEWVGAGSDRPGRTTGTLIDNEGFVLTHATGMASPPDTILVTTWDGKQQLARWVAVDHIRNLLLLKTDPVAVRAFSVPVNLKQVSVGQTVLALGKMLDAKSIHVSEGIVSATGRVWGKATQTDAKVSPLNYGGPLVDLQGRMIGILAPMSMNVRSNEAGEQWYDSGIGFAVNVSDYGETIKKLKSGTDVLMGVSGLEISQENLNATDFPITSIHPGSPAAEAGLQIGDQVTEVNGTAVSCLAEFYDIYNRLAAGDELALKWVGKAGVQGASLKLVGNLPSLPPGCMGFLAEQREGKVRIVSAAGTESIWMVDDEILSINETKIQSLDDLEATTTDLIVGSELAIILVRDQKEIAIDASVKLLQTVELTEQQLRDVVESAGESEVVEHEIRVSDLVQPAALLKHHQPKNNATIDRPLLVMLQDSLQSHSTLLKEWEEDVANSGYDLLVIGPQDKKWTLDDADCVEKLVQEAAEKYSVARNRARVLLSMGDSASIAERLTQVTPPDFAGVVFWDNSPSKLMPTANSPNSHRLMLLAVGKHQPEWVARLQKESVVTGFIDSSETVKQIRKKLAAWIWRVQIW